MRYRALLLLAANDSDAPIVKASSGGWTGWKGLVTIIAYVLVIGVALLPLRLAVLISIAAALLWLTPNRRPGQLLE